MQQSCLIEDILNDVFFFISEASSTTLNFLLTLRKPTCILIILQSQKNVMHLCKGEREDQSHTRGGCTSSSVKYSEIVPVRELIRSKKYPFNDKRHINVDKSIDLSDQMRNFTSEEELFKNQYMCSFLEDDSDNKMCFILITDMEYA